ncbi:GNAT family N-acetyltransferase [Acidipila sp. EB88]|nr:GNAT family N-acetyltransferase [Acidipila sp. EB88]
MIRAAVPADAPLIHAMIVELAVYEREPEAVAISEADLLRDGWGEHPRFTCLVAEDEAGVVCGFALYHPTYSTWQGHSLYLEDLYVRATHRGRGVGTALLAEVASVAVAQGCARLDWQVLTWNEPAIRVYERIGAVRMEEWRRMRLSEDGLAVLAAQAMPRAAGSQTGTPEENDSERSRQQAVIHARGTGGTL